MSDLGSTVRCAECGDACSPSAIENMREAVACAGGVLMTPPAELLARALESRGIPTDALLCGGCRYEATELAWSLQVDNDGPAA